MPTARSGHAAITVGSAIFVLGGKVGEYGEDVQEEQATASVLKFDSTRGTWSYVAPMPGARVEFVACAIGSELYVFGGYMTDLDAQASVFKYDTDADTWSTLAPMPQSVEFCSSTSIDDLVYIVGSDQSEGAGDGHGVLRFEPASGSWSTLAPTIQGRR